MRVIIILVFVLLSNDFSKAQTQKQYFAEHYPNLKTKPGKWKFKLAATDYMNSIRTANGLKPVKLNRWITFKCNMFSVWHKLFYKDLKHANIRAGSWENLAAETVWYIDTWMNSTQHRKNMMSAATYKIGIGTMGGVAVQRGRFD